MLTFIFFSSELAASTYAFDSAYIIQRAFRAKRSHGAAPKELFLPIRRLPLPLTEVLSIELEGPGSRRADELTICTATGGKVRLFGLRERDNVAARLQALLTGARVSRNYQLVLDKALEAVRKGGRGIPAKSSDKLFSKAIPGPAQVPIRSLEVRSSQPEASAALLQASYRRHHRRASLTTTMPAEILSGQGVDLKSRVFWLASAAGTWTWSSKLIEAVRRSDRHR